jgi:hypothetical protein
MYLRNLSRDAYDELKRALWESQNQACYLCERPIDIDLQLSSTDIDHIVPIVGGGKDDPSNFALAHATCNRSKQASNLAIARMLARFSRIADKVGITPGRPHLGDILDYVGGAKHSLKIDRDGSLLRFVFDEIADHEIRTSGISLDTLSGMEYSFIELPIEYLFHDERINPRAIASRSLRSLAEEFYGGLPQLHVALAWITIDEFPGQARIQVFDGQHKAAAQIMQGIRRLPIRIFLNPDIEKLLTANTHAGTTLRQVAFDKSVQRHLGSQLLVDRVNDFRKATGRSEDDLTFSEAELINFFRGQRAEIKRYILDDIRNQITHHEANGLRQYIDFGGRGTERPLSYSSVEKTFYSFFIGSAPLSTPVGYKDDIGENPRTLEVDQIIRLMNTIRTRILEGQFDSTIGTSRLERRIQDDGETIPLGHIRAVRMFKEEILYTWLDYIRKLISNYFIYSGSGVPFREEAPFQTLLPDVLWDQIESLVTNLAGLPLWQDRTLSASVFGGKQTYDWWRLTLSTGTSPSGQKVLARGIGLKDLIA